MHKIVFKIHELLEKAATGTYKVDEKLLEEFGESCKAALKKQLEPEERQFRLRMSNIGRPLRQLMLEQKYGRSEVSPDFLLKMLFGDLYESLSVFLLKSSGIKVVEQNAAVSIPVQTKKGVINLEGTLDLVLELEGKNYVYDVKSASPYSFNNKFDGTSLLTGDDAFGYVDQLFGYAAAKEIEAGGWFVVNKADGEIKVCEVPVDLHDELLEKSIDKIEKKVAYIVEGGEIPPCEGEIEETYYGKSTGNKVLGPSCKFCNYKNKCHPNVQFMPSKASKSKNPKWEYYTEVKK